MNQIKSIGVLAFPNVGEQDLLAAWELLRAHAMTLQQEGEGDELAVEIAAFDDEVITHMGARLGSTRKIDTEDRFDVLYVPGGIGAGAASQDERILDLVRAHHAEGRWVVANCAGLGVLFRAGVLDGVEVTSPATLSRRLAALGADVVSPRLAWSIDPASKTMTIGGAATVHPSTIALVWHLFGPERARQLALAWDSLALHGEKLFSLEGPAMQDDPAATAMLQDTWELMFLPNVPAGLEA